MENLGEQKFSDSKKKNNIEFFFNFNSKRKSVYVLLLLAIVNWVSHFLYFMRFGLYEDDFYNIGRNLGNNFQQLTIVISNHLTNWEQGRPFLFLFPLFTYISDMLGGLYFMYVIAFLIVTINSFMMYKLLVKIFPQSSILTITGALAFCLFPPDTTKLYLLHALFLQVSITFFLAASLLYLNNKKILSYLTITLAILTYESPFMVFFGVPFLKGKWDKKFGKEYLKHFIVLCSIIALIFLYRKLSAELRVLDANQDILGVITKIIAGIFIGPVFNIFLFLRAPIVTIGYLISGSSSLWWYYDYIYYFLLGCFIFFLWLYFKIKPDYNFSSEINSNSGETDFVFTDNISANKYFRRVIRLLIASITLLCLAYSVSFSHYPPTAVMGRLTSVHLAATIGGSIAFACVCASIFFIAERYRLRKYAVIFVSLYLTLLIGYNTYSQKEFVQSWEFQKYYWGEVIRLCPDLEENTVILAHIPNSKIHTTKYIHSFTPFSDKYMLSYLFNFPQTWKKPFYQHIYSDNPGEDIEFKNGQFILHSRDPQKSVFPPMVINDSNVILIKADKNNKLVRIDSSVTINGKKLYLKPREDNAIDNFEKTKLYNLIIKSE